MDRGERRRRTRRKQRDRMERRDRVSGDRWYDGWKQKYRDQPGRHSKVNRSPTYESDPEIRVEEDSLEEIDEWLRGQA